MVSCGSYPALPWAAASPHEVQPPLEQPPVETAAPALTIGNGRLVLLAVSVKGVLPAFSVWFDENTRRLKGPGIKIAAPGNSQSCGLVQ